AKRFAKIGGEMISLAVAERIATAAYPDHRHAVVALPDPRRGERLVLITEAAEMRREALVEAAHREQLPEIAIPRDIVPVTGLPPFPRPACGGRDRVRGDDSFRSAVGPRLAVYRSRCTWRQHRPQLWRRGGADRPLSAGGRRGAGADDRRRGGAGRPGRRDPRP